MPRLFIVFRTFDRIWDNAMFTREFAPLEMDTTLGDLHLFFQVDHVDTVQDCVLSTSDLKMTETSVPLNDRRYYVEPHHRHVPLLFGQENVCLMKQGPQPISSFCCQQSYSLENSQMKDNLCVSVSRDTTENSTDVSVSYFILPMKKCTIIVDAHIASSIKSEIYSSKAFRQRLFRKIRTTSGFKDCQPEYEVWTDKEKDAWDRYLRIPFMLDVITVWPWQKVDYAWCDRIMNLFNKHVTLEESMAWLSTLGGAHSSLGEIFIDHALKAGEISVQQLKLAKELGNEIMIARCYLYWAWSLMQRDYLAQCKICILNTWKYVQKMKCCDKILINMCRAVWSRLQYKRSLKAKSKVRCYSSATKDLSHGDTDSDSSGCGIERTGKDFHNNASFKNCPISVQSVEVF